MFDQRDLKDRLYPIKLSTKSDSNQYVYYSEKALEKKFELTVVFKNYGSRRVLIVVNKE